MKLHTKPLSLLLVALLLCSGCKETTGATNTAETTSTTAVETETTTTVAETEATTTTAVVTTTEPEIKDEEIVIEDGVFKRCGKDVTEVVIPDSVTIIDKYAFAHNKNITSILSHTRIVLNSVSEAQ